MLKLDKASIAWIIGGILAFLVILGFILIQTGVIDYNFSSAEEGRVIVSISPTTGGAGTSVTITGTNLTDSGSSSTLVRFIEDVASGQTYTIQGSVNSERTETTFAIPSSVPAGEYEVKVGEQVNDSNAVFFTVTSGGGGGGPTPTPTPTPSGRVLTSITPSKAKAGQAIVLIGSNMTDEFRADTTIQFFNSSGARSTHLGTKEAGRTKSTFVIPNELQPGQYTVKVGPNINDVSNALSFEVESATPTPTPTPTVVPANIVFSKKVYNMTKGKDATSVAASTGDVINFTLTVENTGGTASAGLNVADNVGDVVELADVTNIVGGVYNPSTKIISWPAMDLNAGAKTDLIFSVKVKSPLPSGSDQIMTNTFGNTVSVSINKPPVSPKTGANDNLMVILFTAGAVLVYGIIRKFVLAR